MKRIQLAGACVVLCLLGVNCGSGGKSTTTTTSGGQGVQINLPASSPEIDAGESVNVTANQSVLWSLQAAPGIPIGCLGSSNPCVKSTTSPSPTITYIAPSSVAVATGVTVVATSPADSTQSAGIGVLVSPPVVIDPTTTLSHRQDCSYNPAFANNNGNAGALYAPQGPQQGLLAVENGTGTGPFTWNLASGSLPVGLDLVSVPHGLTCSSPGCLLLQGTPASAGCAQFQIQVTDATGATATSPTFYVVITPAPLKVQTPNYTDTYFGVAYPPTAFSVSTATLSVPPYVWSVSPTAQLPGNMALNALAGDTAVAVLTGSPTSTPPNAPVIMVADSQTPYPAVGQVGLALTGNLGLVGAQAP